MVDVRDWGPSGWTYLHAVSFSFPDDPTPADRDHYRQFYELVGRTLPCATCRDHYASQLRDRPPAVGSRAELVRWVVDVHNAVRESQSKRPFTYEEATRSILGGARRRRQAAVAVAGVLVTAALLVIVAGIVLKTRAGTP